MCTIQKATASFRLTEITVFRTLWVSKFDLIYTSPSSNYTRVSPSPYAPSPAGCFKIYDS